MGAQRVEMHRPPFRKVNSRDCNEQIQNQIGNLSTAVSPSSLAVLVLNGIGFDEIKTCLTGEVRGSKRKGFERSFLGGTHAEFAWGEPKPEGAKSLKRARAAPLVFVFDFPVFRAYQHFGA